MFEYEYTKSPANPGNLKIEILTELSEKEPLIILIGEDILKIMFSVELTPLEKTLLDQIVADHQGPYLWFQEPS